jgi:hypothetical protein
MSTSSAMARLDSALNRFDDVLAERLRREKAAMEREDAAREDARRVKMRADADERREIQATYADAFQSFGTETPAPVDDEPPSRYRARLFNRLARRLAPDHELSSIRADDLGSQAVVFDNFERMLLDAAKAEGERPSIDNLPPSGEMIARHRADADTGAKVIEFYGRESFIKSMGREGRRVRCIRDPRSGQAIWVTGLPQAR